MKLSQLLKKATDELSNAGIKTAEIDAKVLLEHALSEDDVYLISHSQDLITNSQYSKFRRYIRRRKKGEPVAYITGHKEFYGLDFKVNRNVLIPRPETELLVEQALEFVKSKVSKVRKVEKPIDIIDIGTGSGCIIVSLTKTLETINCKLKSKMFATDVSYKALAVAKYNEKKHGVFQNIKFFCSDLFSNKRLPKKFDLIIANLPYLKPGYKDLDFEPKVALHGGKDGLSIVRKLISLLPDKLYSDGIALLEIDNDQFKSVEKIVGKSKDLRIEEIKTIPHWHGSIKIKKI